MTTIAIVKNTYTKFVDASADAFTAQSHSSDGWEVLFSATQPPPESGGVIVPTGLEYGVSRANGTGHGWGRLPARSGIESATVIVI